MTRSQSLPLPTSSDMNQLAHPGGGTQVTDASSEGLVEDLFEAHLRHLDVATKNAVVRRLAAVADKMDDHGIRTAADTLDLLLVLAAPPATEPPSALTEVSMLIGLMKSLVSEVDPSKIENYAAGRLHEELLNDVNSISELISSSNFEKAALQSAVLDHKLQRYSLGGDLAEAFGGGDSVWGYVTMDKVSEARRFTLHASMLNKKLNEVVKSQGSAGAVSREKSEQPYGNNEVVRAFATKLDTMISEYDGLDAMTDDWKDEMSPESYRQLQAEFKRDIPQLGYLNRLAKYKERLTLGQISPSNVKGYADMLAGLEPILDAFRQKVGVVNARMLSGGG